MGVIRDSSGRLIPGFSCELRVSLHRLILWSVALSAGCQRLPAPVSVGPPLLFAPPPEVGRGQAAAVSAPVEPSGLAPGAPLAPSAEGGNPLHVNVRNREWAWEQIVDIVDDYFRIERESQVRLVGNVLTEGRIDAFPQIGATVVEPQLTDSVGRYNRWESTFQTIRRRAIVRVVPDATGYLIDVEVQKELEDLPQPELARVASGAFRNDSSLPSRATQSVSRTELSPNWIPLGRDAALEQEMKARLKACMGGAGA